MTVAVTILCPIYGSIGSQTVFRMGIRHSMANFHENPGNLGRNTATGPVDVVIVVVINA